MTFGRNSTTEKSVYEYQGLGLIAKYVPYSLDYNYIFRTAIIIELPKNC
jgi:hypothetical protein